MSLEVKKKKKRKVKHAWTDCSVPPVDVKREPRAAAPSQGLQASAWQVFHRDSQVHQIFADEWLIFLALHSVSSLHHLHCPQRVRAPDTNWWQMHYRGCTSSAVVYGLRCSWSTTAGHNQRTAAALIWTGGDWDDVIGFQLNVSIFIGGFLLIAVKKSSGTSQEPGGHMAVSGQCLPLLAHAAMIRFLF